MMNVTIRTPIAYIAVGKTCCLNRLVRAMTSGFWWEASLISLPVPMKKNMVIDCEKRPMTTVPSAMKMCCAV